MLNTFTSLFDWLFSALTTFLSSEPIIYIVGLLLFTIILKSFLDILFSFRNY